MGRWQEPLCRDESGVHSSQSGLWGFLLRMLCCISHVQLFVTPWTVALQVPLSMGSSRQEYWSGCLLLLSGIFLTRGWNPCLLQCRWILYVLSHHSGMNFKGQAGGKLWVHSLEQWLSVWWFSPPPWRRGCLATVWRP